MYYNEKRIKNYIKRKKGGGPNGPPPSRTIRAGTARHRVLPDSRCRHKWSYRDCPCQ